MKTKHLIGALALTAAGSAAATPVMFDPTGTVGDSSNAFAFHHMELFAELLANGTSITQADDGDGFVTGNDTFVEFGGTHVTGFSDPSGFPIPPATHGGIGFNYEVLFDYQVSGTAAGVLHDGSTLADLAAWTDAAFLDGNESDLNLEIDIVFDTLTDTGLWIDNVADFEISGGATQILSFGIATAACSLEVIADADTGNIGLALAGHSCTIGMSFEVLEEGYFYNEMGVDLFGNPSDQPLQATYTAEIQSIGGLNFFYQGAATQDFTMGQDGSISFNVPEPGSLALIAAGLLGVAGAARRRKKA